MALTELEQHELESLLALSSDELAKSPYRKARLQKLQANAVSGKTSVVDEPRKNLLESGYDWAKRAGVVTGTATTAKPSTLNDIQTTATSAPLTPITPSVQAKLDEKNAQQSQPTATGTGGKADEPKKSFDIITEMNNLAGKMNSMPAELQKQFKPRLDDINKAMIEFNQQYQTAQESAKDAAEKAKNRAEWGSIASMLAKNIMGFSAALHGVDPNAMAYQTTDWAQQIKNANDELELNLSNLRENMKMKTEAKLGEKKDIMSEMDDTFKAKMEGLRARAEGNKLRFTAEEAEKDRLDKAARAAEEARQKALEAEKGRTTMKPESLANARKALAEATSLDDIEKIAGAYGLDSTTIDKLKANKDPILPFGIGDDVSGFRSAIASALETKARENPIPTTTSKTGAGQPAAGVVQSPDVKVLNGITYKKIGDKWVKQ
jgi:hypothetical protein